MIDGSGNLYPSTSNSVNLGTSSNLWSNVYGSEFYGIAFNNSSDRRLKSEIRGSDLGLDFIMDLRPVSYRWKSGQSGLHYGFIAQEVEETLNQRGYDSSDLPIVVHDAVTDKYGLRYTELIAPMVKAMQELKQENVQLKQLICSEPAHRDAAICVNGG